MSAPICPLLAPRGDFDNGWHIAGPVWAVQWPIEPRPWLLLEFTENGGHRPIDGVYYLSRRASVRAYWARRKLGCP